MAGAGGWMNVVVRPSGTVASGMLDPTRGYGIEPVRMRVSTFGSTFKRINTLYMGSSTPGRNDKQNVHEGRLFRQVPNYQVYLQVYC